MDKILMKRTDAAKEFDIPQPKKKGDVGYDIYVVEDTFIPAHSGKPTDISTGIKIKLPKDTWALIINRSATPRKLGIEIVPGVIDNGYTGELYACAYNRNDYDTTIKAGSRLAQFILFPVITPKVEEVEDLPETERGETGFGSTGK